MEDELSEARLECSRVKTELVSERSAWEIKISEMTSKINEVCLTLLIQKYILEFIAVRVFHSDHLSCMYTRQT